MARFESHTYLPKVPLPLNVLRDKHGQIRPNFTTLVKKYLWQFFEVLFIKYLAKPTVGMFLIQFGKIL